MRISTILFDLDGTLLPMDQEVFTSTYFKGLAAKLASCGYEPKQLIDSVWMGTRAMVKNDGVKSNEDVFWEAFSGICGEKVLQDKPYFEEFYRVEFQNIKSVCGYNQKAVDIVHQLKKEGFRVILATNPLFPAIATESRIRWSGLEPEDFELYTTYENIGYCKPNPEYYSEIVRRLGVDPGECLMVGNDATEDMIAETLGMKVFLLTDCLIQKEGVDISNYPQGDFDQLRQFIDKIC